MKLEKNIKYYCYYDTINKKITNRSYCLAATNKIDYISQVLNSNSLSVELISLAIGNNRSSWFTYLSSSTIRLNKLTTLKLFPSIASKNVFIRVIGRILTKILFIYDVLLNCNKDDIIIVYHSLGYSNIFCILKKIKKFKLVLEVEEIYADISGKEKDRKNEFKFFKAADAFIFSTEFLEETINVTHKPYTVVHGTYGVEHDRSFRFEDDLTHVVYAGTLDPRKGGAIAAAAAAEFLDENYHMHIIGFGNTYDIESIKRVIEDTKKKTKCSLTYDGLLSGEDYIRFIQACDIGLSTQNPNAAFNVTSFPSKVLSYMANGLRVVSIRIQVVEKSAVGDLISYYEEQTPQNIASAIRNIDFLKTYDSRKRIRELDMLFQQDIKQLLWVFI